MPYLERQEASTPWGVSKVDVEVRCWTVFGFIFVPVSANCHLLGYDDFRMVAISLFVGGIDGGGNLGKVLGMLTMLRPELKERIYVLVSS